MLIKSPKNVPKILTIYFDIKSLSYFSAHINILISLNSVSSFDLFNQLTECEFNVTCSKFMIQRLLNVRVKKLDSLLLDFVCLKVLTTTISNSLKVSYSACSAILVLIHFVILSFLFAAFCMFSEKSLQ